MAPLPTAVPKDLHRKELFIDGKWVAPVLKGTIPVVNPHDEQAFRSDARNLIACASREPYQQVIGFIPAATDEDVDLAVMAAKRAFESGPWAQETYANRATVLRRLAELCKEQKSTLAVLETLDMGKPIDEAEWDMGLYPSRNHSIMHPILQCSTTPETLLPVLNPNAASKTRVPSGRASELELFGTPAASHPLLSHIQRGRPPLQDDVAGCFEYYADRADEMMTTGKKDVDLGMEQFKGYVVKEPLGVVALITPWNYPMLVSAF
eukprot:1188404-Prorocentrum_minimum.AAC.2